MSTPGTDRSTPTLGIGSDVSSEPESDLPNAVVGPNGFHIGLNPFGPDPSGSSWASFRCFDGEGQFDRTATKPVSASFSHGVHEDELVRYIKCAIECNNPQRGRGAFNDVYCISFTWENMPVCAQAAGELMDVMENGYGYKVKRVVLPSGKGSYEVNKLVRGTLLEILEPREENDLVIVHYMGHGHDLSTPGIKPYVNLTREDRAELKGPMVWLDETHQGAHATAFDFSSIGFHICEHNKTEVLYLFDCCVPASAALRFQNFGLVAAMSDESTAYYLGGKSCLGGYMTPSITWILRRCLQAQQYLTTAELHAEIVSHRKTFNVVRMPVHLVPNPIHHYERPVLFLYPLKALDTEMSTTHELEGLAEGSVSVILSAKLSDGTSAIVDRFTHWAASHDGSVKFIAFVPDGASGSLILQVDGAVWNCMQGHDAIVFCGYAGPLPPRQPIGERSELERLIPDSSMHGGTDIWLASPPHQTADANGEDADGQDSCQYWSE